MSIRDPDSGTVAICGVDRPNIQMWSAVGTQCDRNVILGTDPAACVVEPSRSALVVVGEEPTDWASSDVADLHRAVLDGLGLVLMNVAHRSELFRRLMGSTCTMREDAEADADATVHLTYPVHEVTRRLGAAPIRTRLPRFWEPFDVPHPDEVLAVAVYGDGDPVRTAMTYRRTNGRILVLFGPRSRAERPDPLISRLVAGGIDWTIRGGPDQLHYEVGAWRQTGSNG